MPLKPCLAWWKWWLANAPEVARDRIATVMQNVIASRTPALDGTLLPNQNNSIISAHARAQPPAGGQGIKSVSNIFYHARVCVWERSILLADVLPSPSPSAVSAETSS